MNVNKYYEWSSHYDLEMNEIKHLFDQGISFTGKNVMEVGCGTGRFTSRIMKMAKTIEAIDPCEEAIEHCKKEFSNVDSVTFQVATLFDYQDYKKKYDIVVFSWSIYLVDNLLENLKITKEILNDGGKVVILQANKGEYEEEVSKLYENYDSLAAYENANSVLEQLLSRLFCSVRVSQLKCYFTFDDVDQIVDLSTFFVVDEEGQNPSEEKIKQFRERLKHYRNSGGKYILDDLVDVYIATK